MIRSPSISIYDVILTIYFTTPPLFAKKRKKMFYISSGSEGRLSQSQVGAVKEFCNAHLFALLLINHSTISQNHSINIGLAS